MIRDCHPIDILEGLDGLAAELSGFDVDRVTDLAGLLWRLDQSASYAGCAKLAGTLLDLSRAVKAVRSEAPTLADVLRMYVVREAVK